MDRGSASNLGASLCPAQAVVVLGDKAFVVQFDLCTFCDVCESFCLECADDRSFVVVFAQDQTASATHEHQQAETRPAADN
jgi:MinD superfamily P-loop ATPase